MGLRHLEWYLLLLQFGCQITILFALLLSASRRGSMSSVRGPVLHVLGIALGCVLVEKWLSAKLGFLVVVPVLGLTVLVLRNASWQALWTSCVAVTTFALAYQMAVLDLGAVLEARQRTRAEATRKASQPPPVIRYEQIAGELGFAGPKLPRRLGQETQSVAMVTATNPIVAGAERVALATCTTGLATGVVTSVVAVRTNAWLVLGAASPGTNAPMPMPPPPPPRKPDWRGAKAKLIFGGEIVQHGGKRLTQINGRLYEEGESLSTTHAGFHHVWRVVAVQPHDVTLEEVQASP